MTDAAEAGCCRHTSTGRTAATCSNATRTRSTSRITRLRRGWIDAPLSSTANWCTRPRIWRGLDADFCLVAEAGGQSILTAPSDEYFKRVTWQDDIAVGWRPHEDQTHRCG